MEVGDNWSPAGISTMIHFIHYIYINDFEIDQVLSRQNLQVILRRAMQ